MSLILAIETSHPRGSVAVVRDGEVIFEQSFTSERSHNSQVFAPLAEALKIGGSGLQAIVVGLGPGSYTGARIGIAVAQGIAVSRKVPIVGLPSVLAPDVKNLPDEFAVCGDARRGKFFIARVRDGMLEGEITLHDGDELLQQHTQDSAVPWFSFDAKPPFDLANITLAAPSASRLALLASAMTHEAIRTLEQQLLEPHYLAAPFVTKARESLASRAESS